MANKQIIKNMLLAALWTAIGSGTVVMLVAAIQKKDAKQCTGIEINIKGVSNNFFVDKNDILNTIISISGEEPVGKTVGSFDLKEIETALQKNTWIKNAQLYFNNNEKLLVNVIEREPVARVFTTAGTTFYIDSTVAILPLSEKFSARLPVFTNFPSDKKVLLKADSNLLKDMLTISMAIQEDPFYMALIEQVDITPRRTFEMIPKFGNNIIVFGDAGDARQKLNKLQLFYKQVMIKAGWNTYSEINLQFKDQVVAKRKGADDVEADFARTLQLMKVIAENAERQAGDSLHMIIPDNERNTTSKTIIQQSMERDDNSTSPGDDIVPSPKEEALHENPELPERVQDAATKPAPAFRNKPVTGVVKKPVIVKSSGTSIKRVVKPKQADAKKPRLVMPKPSPVKPVIKNEY